MSYSNTRVLLSSVIQPFGPRHGDGPGSSFEATHQIMWAQGVFRPRATTTQWGIDFIAANLLTPCTTLHYPTMAQFKKELRKGYDYVGIPFVAATVHKLEAMVKAVREVAPGSKVVLGGYGTAIGPRVWELGDHVCRGEGVQFMRELLGEPVDRPYVQPEVVQETRVYGLPVGGSTGYVFAGLGCPNGCDFCATSHYFQRKHIRLLPDGRSILSAILDLQAKHPEVTTVNIIDEDFLLNEKRGREFLAEVRKTRTRPLSLSVFSSVKALSQYQPSELVEMGIDTIWCGYEGARAGYSKMEGDTYDRLFPELRAHGISVLASMIIGFDYQDEAIIQEEFDHLMTLRPSMTQVLIYGPAYGTPLFDRMKAEGRLNLEDIGKPDKMDGFHLMFRHDNLGQAQLEGLHRDLCREEFRRLGPSVFRIIEDWFTGHVNLKDHPNERVRAKAGLLGEMARQALPLVAGSLGHVDQAAGAWMAALANGIEGLLGPMNRTEKVLSRVVVPNMIRVSQAADIAGLNQQPVFLKKTFRQNHSHGFVYRNLARIAT